ncbi:MAG: CapA family protein [Tissierellia bacterium]|nr:CapA family protein [Tissierellia bacterium]
MKRSFLKYLVTSLLVFLVIFSFLFSRGYFDPLIKVYANKLESTDKNENIDDKEKEIENNQLQNEQIAKDEFTEASILACGDIMFHMPQNRAALDIKTGEFNFDENFMYIKNILQETDFSMANFETVVNPETKLSGYPNFNSPKETLEAIKNAGFDLLSTANNHSFDRGKSGVLSTIEEIEKIDLEYIGTNKTPETERTRTYDINGIKIGILCYTYGLNGHINNEPYLVNEIDKDNILEDINRLKDKSCDKIILFIHWGTEYANYQDDQQIDIEKFARENGVDIIFGSHPHVIQKAVKYDIEDRDDFKYTIFSMGNFLSNQRGQYLNNNYYTEDGIMVKLTLKKNMTTGETKLKNIEYIPTYVHRYNDELGWHYRIVPVKQALNGEIDELIMTDALKNLLTNSLERTASIIDLD